MYYDSVEDVWVVVSRSKRVQLVRNFEKSVKGAIISDLFIMLLYGSRVIG